MYPFRNKTPKRRDNAANRKNYESHRKDLRTDFNNRCGYCDDSDIFRIRSFTIDHFVPKSPKDFTHDIESNFYYNLVYACSFCNGAKTNKWITKDASIHHDGKQGFIDPTDDDYTNLFKRDKNGTITCNGINEHLSEYIISELKLWYPVHRITWKIEKLNHLETGIALEIKALESSNRKTELEAMHNEIKNELADLFLDLFAENE
jgi:5-methylcytosine-specific restriction endonuclease McrA